MAPGLARSAEVVVAWANRLERRFDQCAKQPSGRGVDEWPTRVKLGGKGTFRVAGGPHDLTARNDSAVPCSLEASAWLLKRADDWAGATLHPVWQLGAGCQDRGGAARRRRREGYGDEKHPLIVRTAAMPTRIEVTIVPSHALVSCSTADISPLPADGDERHCRPFVALLAEA